MKTIVCFGDSNTYGFGADRGGARLGPQERWTGLLQQRLGAAALVVEAGQNGRTFCQSDPLFPGCNGSEELPRVLLEHPEADLLVIMLGSNDLKTRYGLSARDVAGQLEALLNATKDLRPRTLVMAPAPLLPRALTAFSSRPFGPESLEFSRLLSPLYQEAAMRTGCGFLDAGTTASPGHEDGVHLSLESHQRLAGAVYEWIAREWEA